MIRMIAITLTLSAPAWAHQGHDHAPPPAVLESVSVPRAIAEGEAFELVAVAGEGGLILYLDHYDSNAPVTGARMEVESSAMRAFAVEREPGVYDLPGEAFTRPGTHTLVVTVQASDTMDLLATTLVIEEPSRAHDGYAHPIPAWGWGVGAGMLAAVLAGYAAMRRKQALRP